jgi:DNA-directed RNA polymerase subunit RPC12/RpoP
MSCPHCGSNADQKRADGRCVSCGKIVPKELRAEDSPQPVAPLPMSDVMQTDNIECPEELHGGDIVIFVRAHRQCVLIKRIPPSKVDEIVGPKYVVPDGFCVIAFVKDGGFVGWMEYQQICEQARSPSKPWWKFW